jgi:outer membrane protein TolC
MMIRKAVVTICGLLFSLSTWGKPLSPPEFNECIYNYWGTRVNSGIVDAHAATDTAKAAVYPSLTGSIAAQEDLLSNPWAGSYVGGYISLSQSIVNISQWATIHARGISEKAAQLDFEDQLLSLMKTATTTIYGEFQTANRLKLLQQRLSRMQKAVNLAKETNRLHLTDSSAIYLAQADKQALEISITNAEAETAASLNLLKASIGMGEAPLELDENYNPNVSDDMTYWEKKIDELPGLQVLKARTEASGALATSYRDLAIPNLLLTTDFGQVPQVAGLNTGSSALVVVSLNFPIFDQGLRSIQAQQADSQKNIFEAQVSSKREALLAEIKNLLNQWQADERVSKIAKDQYDNARQGYDALLTLFSFGKADFVSVRSSEASLVQSEIQLVNLQRKIAGEKTILELMSDYSNGRHHRSRVKCPIR